MVNLCLPKPPRPDDDNDANSRRSHKTANPAGTPMVEIKSSDTNPTSPTSPISPEEQKPVKVGEITTDHESKTETPAPKKPAKKAVKVKAKADPIPVAPVFVVALRGFQATKPEQLTFATGDVIQVVKAKGVWHRGKLHSSKTLPITGDILRFPSNLVTSLDEFQKLQSDQGEKEGSPAPVDEPQGLETADVSAEEVASGPRHGVADTHKDMEVTDEVIRELDKLKATGGPASTGN